MSSRVVAHSGDLVAPTHPPADAAPFRVLARRDSWQARVEIPWIVRTLGIPRHSRILEVGCGQGNALRPLALRCAPSRLVGLDVDSQALEEAGRRTRASGIRAELFAGDVRRLPFPDAAFDVVLDFGTCYHLARPEQALREIVRVLTRGGRLVHETTLGQRLSHPFRSSGRSLPWSAVGELRPGRHAVLFASRIKE